ncbi:MAG: HAD-IC family P-type ATPase, partial [Pseudomonadota bacterium]
TALRGMGLQARIEGQDILIGTARLMAERAVALSGLEEAAAAMSNRTATPVFVALDGRAVAVLSVTDQIKPGAADAIRALKSQGKTIALLTGDTQSTADAIAKELGIDIVHAERLPGDKQTAIQDLRKAYGAVAFVGDGINDAPALAQADVGIAMGDGTDVAIEAADIALIWGDPKGVARAISLSTRTMRNIRQNLFWAFAYNAALIPVAAGVLFPALGLLLSPMLAAGAMALSSVFVVTNALRLRKMTP